MAAIVYSGLPIVSRREAHVVVDLVDPLMPPRVVPVQQILINLICAAFFAFIAWRLWVLAGETLRFRDVTEYLRISRAPISYFGACLSALAATIHALKAMISVVRLLGAEGGAR
jgi:TRAP-type transport system small permease protein